MGEYADEAVNRLILGPWHMPRRRNKVRQPDKALAAARCRAHSAFDQLWRSGRMSRTKAYKWLAQSLGVPDWQAHMSRMDIATCDRVVALCAPMAFEDLDAWADELRAQHPELAHLI